MALTIILKHGARADIPTSGMSAGLPLFCTDTGELFFATDATTTITAVPDIASLAALGTPAVGDLIMMQDVSVGSGVKMKKITFEDFKTALNIPEGATDEKVAVISGGTAGYLWGTDGTNGVIRMGAGMGWTKDGGDGFVTLKLYFASEAQGDIIYRDSSAWARLAAAAAAGYVLQSGGAAANPSWTATLDGGTFT